MKLTLKNQIVFKSATFILAAVLIWSTSYTRDQQQLDKKKTATVELSFYKNADGDRTIVANVSTKNDSGKLVFVRGVKINFYTSALAGKSFLGEALTSEGGKASIHFPKEISTDTSGVTIIARIENDKGYEDAEAQASVKDARLVLSLSEGDSSKLISVLATEILANGKEKPIPNVEVNFGIQRLFGIMPLSDEANVTTDDRGMATFNFPKEIKGDEKGNVVLVARIIDNEVYGNVEATSISKWGEPLVVEKNPFPRALWEPRAPIILIISFSIIFGGIWFTYGFVIYQITKIEKKASA
ncbi:MAG: hypothetical protein EKK39_02475 [Sphingobacteriales bacterium]|uniref:hypothetical protein n=1 Tax=Hydrotalea flava TaxID=714549 RepID=UPI0008318937|nr:hypothetical protein [Hydrotalea flava]RTL55686.1 MAG: hypothetical protein EKK39_02475 [Sphingobacteriales bacterium]